MSNIDHAAEVLRQVSVEQGDDIDCSDPYVEALTDAGLLRTEAETVVADDGSERAACSDPLCDTNAAIADRVRACMSKGQGFVRCGDGVSVGTAGRLLDFLLNGEGGDR